MKKVSILFVSALALGMTFTSCSKDDAPASVEGKWNFNKMSVSSNGVVLLPEQDYEGNEATCAKDYMELESGQVYNEGDYDVDCEFESTTGSWTKSGKDITVTAEGETFVFTVVSVSGSVLKAKTTYTEDGTSYTVNMSFTKA